MRQGDTMKAKRDIPDRAYEKLLCWANKIKPGDKVF